MAEPAEPKQITPAVMFGGPEEHSVAEDRPRSPREYYEQYFKPRPETKKANEEKPSKA